MPGAAMRTSLPHRHAPSEHLLQIAGGLLFFFLFLRFVDESLGPSPKAEALAALATVLLILALATQYGRHLFARLKKLGPLELFEKEAPELIERLKEVLEPLDVEMLTALRAPLSPEAEDSYQYVFALIRHVEFSGA